MKTRPLIFLSYAREDEEKVEILYQKLCDEGFEPWMDKKGILPGEKWELRIQETIRDADFFLVCLSTNSINRRGPIQLEIRQALDIWQRMLDSDIFLIPARLEYCEVPKRLREFHCVNLFEDTGWPQLVKAINEGMERRAEAPRSVVKPSKVRNRKIPRENSMLVDQLDEQKQRLLKETRSRRILTLLGFRIFDWLTIERKTEYVLGEAEAGLYLRPLPIKPYCSSLLGPPILQWLQPAGAENISVELYQIDGQRNSTKIWQQDVQGTDCLDAAQLGFTFSHEFSYNWALSYQHSGEWIFHNGLFNILSQDSVDEYRQAEAKLQDNNSITESDSRLLQAGILFDYELYDILLERLLAALPQAVEVSDRIPLLALLREVYLEFSEGFKSHNLPKEEDRVLLRIAAVEDELDSLYNLKTTTG